MTRFSVFLAASVIAAGTLGLATDSRSQTVLRYAHVGAEGESQSRYATELAALIKEKTGGKVEIRVTTDKPEKCLRFIQLEPLSGTGTPSVRVASLVGAGCLN
jgi:hypothetical protein